MLGINEPQIGNVLSSTLLRIFIIHDFNIKAFVFLGWLEITGDLMKNFFCVKLRAFRVCFSTHFNVIDADIITCF